MPLGAAAGAKALFAALCIHGPSFVTDVGVLAARGFNPLAALPHLLAKQALMAAAVTLPSMALATVVNNLAQFILGVPLLFLAAMAWVLMGRHTGWEYLAGSVQAVAAVSIVLVQYRQRRTGVARILAPAGGLAAGALLALTVLTPIRAAAPAQVAAAGTSIGLATGKHIYSGCVGEDRVHFEIPVVAKGFPEADHWTIGKLAVEVTGANGARYDDRVQNGAEMFAGWSLGPDGTLAALSLSMPREFYDRLKDGKVTVAGKFILSMYQASPVRLHPGERRDVPGVGRCSCQPEGGRVVGVCESTSRRPMQARVGLWVPVPHGGGAREEMLQLEPDRTLLSPLHRAASYFWVGGPRPEQGGETEMLVQGITGQRTVEIDLHDVQLPEVRRCVEL